MPDGDKIRGLYGRYTKSFHMLCANQFNSDTTAVAVLKAMTEDLKAHKGTPTDMLAQGISCLPTSEVAASLNWVQAWPQLSSQIDMLARLCECNNVTKNIALSTLKNHMTNLSNGKMLNAVPSEPVNVIEAFLARFYRARFEEPVSRVAKRPNGIIDEVYHQRLAELAPLIKEGVTKMARQRNPGSRLPVLSFRPEGESDDVDFSA